MRRVYYSAYVPVGDERRMPALPNPPLLREHRLYQCDFLQRQYGFHVNEILPEEFPVLDPNLDPKCVWALRNLKDFPVEVNKAPFETLLRVPGIGRKGAERIVTARRAGRLQPEDLKRLRIVLKRAKYFLTCNGRVLSGIPIREDILTQALTQQERSIAPPGLFAEQTALFAAPNDWRQMTAALPLLPSETGAALPIEMPNAF